FLFIFVLIFISFSGSKTKAALSASNKPPTLTIKEEPGVTTRKRGSDSEASNVPKKLKAVETVVISIDDDS
ncbi:hypothetical protein A2U01_0072865, partial [Trifolium medium]|nr:hypothetical protein [Trifolium medium]